MAEPDPPNNPPYCEIHGLMGPALEYANGGIPVFPLYGRKDGSCGCHKGPGCLYESEHPYEGSRYATTDFDAIRGYWSKWPSANIGLRTGEGFAALVITDVDLVDHILKEPPQTRMIRTPKGGLQVWLTEQTISPSGVLVPGVAELWAMDGYIVAPPSTTPTGRYTSVHWVISGQLRVRNAEAWSLGFLAAFGLRTTDIGSISQLTTWKDRKRFDSLGDDDFEDAACGSEFPPPPCELRCMQPGPIFGLVRDGKLEVLGAPERSNE